jgi:hypothetical protein
LSSRRTDASRSRVVLGMMRDAFSLCIRCQVDWSSLPESRWSCKPAELPLSATNGEVGAVEAANLAGSCARAVRWGTQEGRIGCCVSVSRAGEQLGPVVKPTMGVVSTECMRYHTLHVR